MKPYPFAPYRFDIDRYLDEQLAAQKESQRQDAFEAEARRGFRSWAIRLNARIEGWMDRVDWPHIDMILGTIGGFAITGVVCWFLWVCADAWLQGRFNVGGN
jgi:hypothetical protein